MVLHGEQRKKRNPYTLGLPLEAKSFFLQTTEHTQTFQDKILFQVLFQTISIKSHYAEI